MADDPEHAPKKYGFKPTEFDRANAPASESAPPAGGQSIKTDGQSAGGSCAPIEIKDIYRAAGIPPFKTAASPPPQANEVHAILSGNLAAEQAAGLHQTPVLPKRKSRRRRDYLLLMVLFNGTLAVLAAHALRERNAVLLVYSIAGMGFISAGLTWVLWFVMDDY